MVERSHRTGLDVSEPGVVDGSRSRPRRRTGDSVVPNHALAPGTAARHRGCPQRRRIGRRCRARGRRRRRGTGCRDRVALGGDRLSWRAHPCRCRGPCPHQMGAAPDHRPGARRGGHDRRRRRTARRCRRDRRNCATSPRRSTPWRRWCGPRWTGNGGSSPTRRTNCAIRSPPSACAQTTSKTMWPRRVARRTAR